MADQPTISVLIPTYNRAEFLPRTLTSVFNQTVPLHEVLLVDDGSTDATPQVVQSLMSQHPAWQARLRYVRQENRGKSAALNTLLGLADGEWLAFLDSDDLWLADKLEWQLRALRAFPECGGCFTDSVLSPADRTETELHANRPRYPECFPSHDGPIGKVASPSLLFCRGWAGIYMQTVLVRRSAMRVCGDFDPRLRLGEDMDFLFRLGLVTSLCYVDLPLVEIHRDPARSAGLMTSNPPGSLVHLKSEEDRMLKWLGMAETTADLRRVIKHDLASVRSAQANRYIAANDFRLARRALWRGVRECFEFRLLAKLLMTYLAPSVLRKQSDVTGNL